MNLLLVSNFIINDLALSQDVAINYLKKSEIKLDASKDLRFEDHDSNQNKSFETSFDWKKFEIRNNSIDEISNYINKQKIIVFNSKTKENLSQNLISLFIKYNGPTWLIMGSLSEISPAMQQGLLRFIEEPPQNLNIILSARSKNDILTTILSRCEVKVIPSYVSFKYIDKEKNDELISALLPPKEFIQNLLQNKSVVAPEFKNVSREGLETWLWQLEYLTSEVILKNGHSERLKSIFENILQAKNLNRANVLNRLVWAQLFV